MPSATFSPDQRSYNDNNDENENCCFEAMDSDQNEDSLSREMFNKNQLKGTAFEAIMSSNGVNTFKSTKENSKRRLLGDITNSQKSKKSKPCIQKRNVQKHGSSQISITKFAVTKYRKTIDENEATKIDKDADVCSERILPWHDDECSSSSEARLEIDVENINEKDFVQLTQNNDSPTISEDADMHDLRTRFSLTLGKRFCTEFLDAEENAQIPFVKRRKKGKKEKLEKEVENKEEEGVKKCERESVNETASNETSKENVEESTNKNFPYETTKYSLVIVKKPCILTAGFACISKHVLKKLLTSMDPQTFLEKYTLIDCRYPYEYCGGHIKGALNIYDPVVLEKTFFPGCAPTGSSTILHKIPIFYCEFSRARGPVLASHLRKSDRVRNYDRYPFVNYKEIYVLEGGYRSFYYTESFQKLCEPMGYVSMRAKEHIKELQSFHTNSVRNGIGFTTSMFQTAVIRKNVAFHRSCSTPVMQESPTAEAFASISPKRDATASAPTPMLLNPCTPTGRKNSHHFY